MLTTHRLAGLMTAVAVSAMATGGCDVNKALERQSEARRLAADLSVQFSKAADASNRAVMADTDEASLASAHEAEQAKQVIQKDSESLKAVLLESSYSDETRLLQEFVTQFGAYQTLDATILELAVLNTNLKAQRLSFGPAQQEADAFRDALERIAPGDPVNTWRVKAFVATAIASVREMQALQAPHIADAADAVMTRIEQRMAACNAAARSALEDLRPFVQPASRPQLASATAALDRFGGINAEIMALSRRNTNVRSLVLSLDQKKRVTTACEGSLRALRESLEKRGYHSSR